MSATAAVLRDLHHARTPGDPLVLPGPWDAASARVFADAGFPAPATPSAGIAACLGHADGRTPADEMFAAVARITRAVDVPVTADVEAGYGLGAAELVERLLDAGAVGCNLEDTDHATGALRAPEEQAEWLARVRAAAGDDLVINARIDTYLHDVPGGGTAAGHDGAGDDPAAQKADAVRRGRLYAGAGADCVYPLAAPPSLLGELAAAVALPVNALALPDGPSPRALGALGATRVTFGPGLQRRAMAAVREMAEDLRAEG
ncbi:isocitrate lyase/PEP mutase family protein [Streptomyces kronopolitis]|uniref:isocitrate lyase/PEP mutase family protein n=1 Tax=Streptomyces kronopolitis TaxID=1612435 RepID=UPI00343CF648